MDINSPTYQQFIETMHREGQTVDIDGKQVSAFFRTDKSIGGSKAKESYITLFTMRGSGVVTSSIVSLASDKYIALKDNTNENDTYDKTYCVRCNQTINYMLRHSDNANKADLTVFYVNADDISQTQSINSSILTLTSSGHFTFPLNDLTRRLNINERFYAGNKIPWKIRDIVFQNGLCEIYADRDTVDTTNDDLTALIADRWTFEHKPDTYTITAEPTSVTLTEGSTQAITVSVAKNGTVMSPTPTITWTASNADCTVTDNTITAVSAGECSIVGSYKAQDNDICNTATIAVTVNAKPVVANIVISPACDYTDYFGLPQGTSQKFTASIDGIASPQWTITLNANGNAASTFKSVISGNTFTVTANARSNNYLVYTISEATSGKSTTYNIKMVSLF